jgi:hypothetical protein
MTRRGSLAYYLVGWVCGSFFLTSAYYPYFVIAQGAPRHGFARNFLFTFFFSLLLSGPALLLGSLILRRVATHCGWRNPWLWVSAGTASFVGVLALLGGLGFWADRQGSLMWLRMTLMFLVVGPWFALRNAWWLPLLPFAATSYLLFRVHRRFESAAEIQGNTSPEGSTKDQRG